MNIKKAIDTLINKHATCLASVVRYHDLIEVLEAIDFNLLQMIPVLMRFGNIKNIVIFRPLRLVVKLDLITLLMIQVRIKPNMPENMVIGNSTNSYLI